MAVKRMTQGEVAARLSAERRALDQVKARATPPAQCGSEMPVAPGRGPMLRFTPREAVITERGNVRTRNAGWQGLDAARVADAFDRMEAAARRAHERKPAKGRPAFEPPFTPGQMEVGRQYAALVERVSASGISLSSVERGAGGRGGGVVEAAVMDDIRRLRVLRARVGRGVAKQVLRKRPADGAARVRRSILARVLVDMVCLGDKTLGEVLWSHGWRSDDTKALAALREELGNALDRMRGHGLAAG